MTAVSENVSMQNLIKVYRTHGLMILQANWNYFIETEGKTLSILIFHNIWW